MTRCLETLPLDTCLKHCWIENNMIAQSRKVISLSFVQNCKSDFLSHPTDLIFIMTSLSKCRYKYQTVEVPNDRVGPSRLWAPQDSKFIRSMLQISVSLSKSGIDAFLLQGRCCNLQLRSVNQLTMLFWDQAVSSLHKIVRNILHIVIADSSIWAWVCIIRSLPSQIRPLS